MDSVLAQTFNDFEVIVVNDGSTDNTEEVVKQYLTDSRVRYICQENSGQAHAKNTGIMNTSGSFIAFLDADDFWAPDKLERQLPFFDDPQVGVVYSTAKYIDENAKPLNLNLNKYLQPKEGIITRHLLFDNFVPFSSSVVRREVFDKVGLFDESLGMGIDWDLWLRASLHYKFRYVDYPLLYYRIGHSGQMSNNVVKRHQASDFILDRFIRNNKGIIDKLTKRQINHYTCFNRSEYFRRNDNLIESTLYLMKSIMYWPFSLDPIKSLTKNLILILLKSEYKDYQKYVTSVISDLHRYDPERKDILSYLIKVPGFRYTFLMRTARYLKSIDSVFGRVCYILIRLLLHRCRVIYGIDIPYNTDIGEGLYIGHYGGIVVSHEAKIGRNCNINHDVTIGAAYGGKHPGTPVIGDRVYLGPGSRIIGGITIGDNVAVGANAVVTSNVEDNAVVAGVPARVISHNGSVEYVINTVDPAR
jgi:serine acetyltransferase/GT2 family glycosyltransferase